MKQVQVIDGSIDVPPGKTVIATRRWMGPYSVLLVIVPLLLIGGLHTGIGVVLGTATAPAGGRAFAAAWIGLSALMIVASVTMFLLVRQSQRQAVPTSTTNLAMFAVPVVGYLAIDLARGHSLGISPTTLLTVAAALVFRDEVTRRKLIGIGGVTVGLILLFVR